MTEARLPWTLRVRHAIGEALVGVGAAMYHAGEQLLAAIRWPR